MAQHRNVKPVKPLPLQLLLPASPFELWASMDRIARESNAELKNRFLQLSKEEQQEYQEYFERWTALLRKDHEQQWHEYVAQARLWNQEHPNEPVAVYDVQQAVV